MAALGPAMLLPFLASLFYFVLLSAHPAGKVLYETSGWVGHPRLSPDGALIAFIDHPTPGDDGGGHAPPNVEPCPQ